MKQLYKKVGGIIEYPEHGDLVFTAYVEAVKQNFLKKKKQAEVQHAHV